MSLFAEDLCVRSVHQYFVWLAAFQPEVPDLSLPLASLICCSVTSYRHKHNVAVFVANENVNNLYVFCVCRANKSNLPSTIHLLLHNHSDHSQMGCETRSQFPLVMNAAQFPLLDDQGQTLRRFLAIHPLCAHFLFRLYDDVNRPLATSFLLLGIRGELALILTHLLLCWGPNGPQTFDGGHFCSCFWTVSLQLVSRAALWVDLLCSYMVKRTLNVSIRWKQNNSIGMSAAAASY